MVGVYWWVLSHIIPKWGLKGMWQHIYYLLVYSCMVHPPIMCVESLLITVLEFSKPIHLLSFKLPHFIVRETDKEKKEIESKKGKVSSFLFLLLA